MIAALSLTAAARQLLEASTVEVTAAGLAVFCPTGTSFDAAEALRLELVAKVPTGVAVDVQIAPSLPGELSAEDEAGARLFASQWAERMLTLRAECGLSDPDREEDFGPDVRLFVLGASPLRAKVTVSIEGGPERAARLAGVGLEVDEEPFPWDE